MNLSPETADRMVSLYLLGRTLRQIARSTGYSHETVRTTLASHGVRLRARSWHVGRRFSYEERTAK